MWEDAAGSTCVRMWFSVLLSEAQKAEQAACTCPEPEGSVVCNVSGEHQPLRLSTARWWKSCDVWEERSCGDETGMGSGWGSGLRRQGGCSRAQLRCTHACRVAQAGGKSIS